MVKRFRKAIAGGWAGGVAAVSAGFVFTGLPTRDQIGQLIGVFIVGFVLGAVGVAAAPANAPKLP